MGPDPAPAYIRPELISGGNAPKSITISSSLLAAAVQVMSHEQHGHDQVSSAPARETIRAIPASSHPWNP
jgi:hypothetical protein